MKFFRINLCLLLILAITVSGTCVISALEDTSPSAITEGQVSQKLKTAPKITSIKNTSGGISLKWKKVKGASGYYVYRKTAKNSFKKVATVKNGSSVKYTNKSVKSNTKYFYKIKAYNSKYTSPNSASKALLRIGTPSMTVKNTSAAIKVSWKKVKGASKYVLMYKKSSAKKYKKAYKGTKLSYTNDNIANGGKYDFKIKAYIKNKSGAYSPVATHVFLEKPTLSAEELLDMEGITLDWQKVKGAKGYYIYRSLKSQNSYKKIMNIKNGSTVTYKDKDVVSINSYKYYIVAYNGSCKSVKSNVDSDVYGYFVDFDTPLTLTISKGEVYEDIYNKLKEYSVDNLITWKSDNSSVARVSSKGIITGVKKGTATLTAKGEYNGKEHTIKIIVTVK